MAEVKEKAVLMTVGNVRVKEYDSQNVVLERYEETVNPVTKETNSNWRFKGYFNSILNALTFVVRKELLIDINVVNDLKSYLKQVEDSNNKILEELNK